MQAIPLEQMPGIVRRRQFMINMTIAAYVFIFVAAFVAVIVTWNVRNLKLGQANLFQRAKNKVLFAAILAAVASLVAVFTIIARSFARGKVNTLPITALLLILALGLGGISYCLFYVHTGAGSNPRGKQDKYLKAAVGMGSICISGLLFILLFSIGLGRDVKQLVTQ